MLIADNHDMSRLYPGVGENLARYKMAMTFLATTRGIPQMLYGTELLMTNPDNGDHGRLRADFPGGWADDKVNAFKGKGLASDVADAQSFIKKLFQWRRSASAIHDGELLHFAPRDGIYVYFPEQRNAACHGGHEQREESRPPRQRALFTRLGRFIDST